jgi:hypothetical protein
MVAEGDVLPVLKAYYGVINFYSSELRIIDKITL